jgi:ABC-type Fe3+/spermidine/putrescine transport system ATPase subunit
MPHELSGGQQQRVQLARSLVLNSAILLLDEPLAALDARLRKSMCYELKRIQEQVGITFVHVTHNQEEAMTIADRIAVIAGGELIEEGSVRDIYERPQRRFTADFIGDNTLLDGTVTAVSGRRIDVDLGFAVVAVSNPGKIVKIGQQVSLSIRPEVAAITSREPVTAGLQALPAVFIEQVYLGFSTTALVRFANGQEGLVRTLSEKAGNSLRPGQQVSFVWPPASACLHTD